MGCQPLCHYYIRSFLREELLYGAHPSEQTTHIPSPSERVGKLFRIAYPKTRGKQEGTRQDSNIDSISAAGLGELSFFGADHDWFPARAIDVLNVVKRGALDASHRCG